MRESHDRQAVEVTSGTTLPARLSSLGGCAGPVDGGHNRLLIKDSKTSGRRNLALSGCAEAEGGEPQSSPRPEFR